VLEWLSELFPSFERFIVWDTEFQAKPGERPVEVCCTARELCSRQEWQQFRGEFGPEPPFPVDDKTLFVGFYNSAELGFHKALGWPEPVHQIDLYIEFRNLTNGLWLPHGSGLVGAMNYFGLEYPADKGEMIKIINRGNWSAEEVHQIRHYNWVDMDATAQLFVKMAPRIDPERAIFRGLFPPVAATMEWLGLPIDVETLERLRHRWGDIQDRLIHRIDQHGVYDGRTFKADRWAALMNAKNIPWPRLDSGLLDLEDGTFRQAAKTYPDVVGPYRELRHALSQMRLADLAVGRDGRNRVLTSYYRARTSRSQPSNAKSVMGTSVWLRNLITPERGKVVIVTDYSQQEFGEGAGLAPDLAMQRAYNLGDAYLGFAVEAGATTTAAVQRYLLRKAKRKKHDLPFDGADLAIERIRDLYKPVVLGIQYERTEFGLARALDMQPIECRRLIEQSHIAFSDFWSWSDRRLNYALAHRRTHTVLGWTLHVPDDTIEEIGGRLTLKGPNVRAIRNFAFQANAAEMTRLAVRLLWERGGGLVDPLMTVHDAIIGEAAWGDRYKAAELIERCMVEASKIVLGGFALRAESKIIGYGRRYTDPRGDLMWNEVLILINDLEKGRAA
jgi:DNA polymerase I